MKYLELKRKDTNTKIVRIPIAINRGSAIFHSIFLVIFVQEILHYSLLSFPYSIIRTDGLSPFEDANRELFSLSFVGVSVRGSRMSREASGA